MNTTKNPPGQEDGFDHLRGGLYDCMAREQLSLRKAAKQIGVSNAALQAWSNGKHKDLRLVGDTIAKKVAVWLGVPFGAPVDEPAPGTQRGAQVIELNAKPPPFDFETLSTAVIVQHLKMFVDDGFSLNRLAQQMGVEEAELENWLHYGIEHVRDKDDPLAKKASRWFSQARAADGHIVFARTPTSLRILHALEHAQKFGRMVIVTSGPGFGKSATTLHFGANNALAHVFTASPSRAGLIPALQALAEGMGIPDTLSGAAQLSRAIAGHMHGWNSVIVVDEAQHLSIPAVEELRAIHDATRCGLALLGNEHSYSRFSGPRAAYYAQIRSRFALKLFIEPHTIVREDAIELLKAWGCPDPRCINPVFAMARTTAVFREVNRCFQFCVEEYGEVCFEGIMAYCGLLGIEGEL